MSDLYKTEKEALADLVREKIRQREEAAKAVGARVDTKFWQEVLRKLKA